MATKHRWQFKARFRRHAFGWRSQPAIQRIREAVSEIKRAGGRDPVLAADGAVAFLERLSPAIENIDGSSGAIGTAVNHAIEALVPVIAQAQAEAKIRQAWLERLWNALQDDEIPYLETLGDFWGELCASKEEASRWADRLLDTCKMAWGPDPELRGFFSGTTPCLSALLAAKRYEELLALLEMSPHPFWHCRKYGVRALAAMGKISQALRYAEDRELNDIPTAIARTCEGILLSAGLVEEAYTRYAFEANRASTYLAWFRAVAKKYSHKEPAEVLADLVAATPGDEGKWFAAAKSAGLLDEALELAARSPCDPKTLARAARGFAEKSPAFAVRAGILALRWLALGPSYEITSADVRNAYECTMRAAQENDSTDATREIVRRIVASDRSAGALVREVLGRELGL